MKTPILLSLILISAPLFAGTPDQPCRSSKGVISQQTIDDILNNPDRSPKGGVVNNPMGYPWSFMTGGRAMTFPGRTNQDFISPVDRVTIPGIPLSPGYDKTQYHLLKATPNHLLRDLSPDRPDATESPITVDAGRYQIEASFFDYRRDKGIETFTYGQINLKAGLTHNIDLQAVIDVRSKTGGEWTTFGDLTLRLKYNLWGNDEGDTALALMPYIIAPTRGDEWQGGLIIPWATNLTDDLSFGLQGQIDFVHDGIDHNTEFLFTAVLGYPIIGKLGGYSEYIGVIAEDRYESYYSGGLTYEVNENLVLDTGIQIGLNGQSENFGLFTGFTKRF